MQGGGVADEAFSVGRRRLSCSHNTRTRESTEAGLRASMRKEKPPTRRTTFNDRRPPRLGWRPGLESYAACFASKEIRIAPMAACLVENPTRVCDDAKFNRRQGLCWGGCCCGRPLFHKCNPLSLHCTACTLTRGTAPLPLNKLSAAACTPTKSAAQVCSEASAEAAAKSLAEQREVRWNPPFPVTHCLGSAGRRCLEMRGRRITQS